MGFYARTSCSAPTGASRSSHFVPDNGLRPVDGLPVQGLDDVEANALWAPFFRLGEGVIPTDYKIVDGPEGAPARRAAGGTWSRKRRAAPTPWSARRPSRRARPHHAWSGAATPNRRACSCTAMRSLWLPASTCWSRTTSARTAGRRAVRREPAIPEVAAALQQGPWRRGAGSGRVRTRHGDEPRRAGRPSRSSHHRHRRLSRPCPACRSRRPTMDLAERNAQAIDAANAELVKVAPEARQLVRCRKATTSTTTGATPSGARTIRG